MVVTELLGNLLELTKTMVLVIAELTLNMCVQQSKRATASLKFLISVTS